ncbi:MAG: phosphoglycerate kinase [Patescibacteria group bacterium]|nr:phosphoglycerate kinase [Patescibacteria group bacterium]
MIRFLSRTDPETLRGTVLLRLDFNTEDDWRMRAVLPTIRLLAKYAGKIVIISHRGRPTKPFDKKFSLRKNASHLAELLRKKIIFIDHFDFHKAGRQIATAPAHSIFLLENLRFLPGEEKNNPKLAKQLASLADFYVNDAFAVSHRANASVAAITRFLPSYAGLELEQEIENLTMAMEKPRHPFVFIVGGAKAADKLGVVRFFKNKTTWFLLGGGPANTVLALRGMDVGQSVKDEDTDLKAIKKIAAYRNILLPVDLKWRRNQILDIGPKTAVLYAKTIAGAKTILWSGPMGQIESKRFSKGSLALARAIAQNRRAFSLTGGGETVMFLKKMHLDKKFSFISTGGGAMLDFLAGRTLPGIAALEK